MITEACTLQRPEISRLLYSLAQFIRFGDYVESGPKAIDGNKEVICLKVFLAFVYSPEI